MLGARAECGQRLATARLQGRIGNGFGSTPSESSLILFLGQVCCPLQSSYPPHEHLGPSYLANPFGGSKIVLWSKKPNNAL